MKIAMVSSWHVHAKGYAKNLLSDSRCEIVAVYDEREELGRKWAEELGCRFEPDYDALLASPDVEGVVICSATNRHPELLIKAAKAGKAIFTEKVLTLTKAEALEVKKAVDESGVLFTISYPHKCSERLLKAKELLATGKFGRPTYCRVRNVHDGSIRDWLPPHFYDPEQCGGGAMIDLGAHPMYLLEWFLGTPKNVQSCFTNITGHAVEDNAVSVIEFENGAIGVSETGFVSANYPYEFEISCTNGCIVVWDNIMKYANPDTDGILTECTDLPTAPARPIIQWVDAYCNGTPSPYGIDEAVSLSALMDAAYRSYRTGAKADV